MSVFNDGTIYYYSNMTMPAGLNITSQAMQITYFANGSYSVYFSNGTQIFARYNKNITAS